LLSGVTAMTSASQPPAPDVPTLMGLPAVPLAVSIGVTISSPRLVVTGTYAVLPSGMIAMAVGKAPAPPTLIAAPGLPVAARIGMAVAVS
jgi:hypothetical protein